ncbi:MAG: hypothetical protein ACFB4J_06045 [Elainellaceae cyanobacterium]
MKQRKGHIASIAIGEGSFQGASLQCGASPITYSQAAWNLAEQGWHVDIFAHQSQPSEIEHPRYREIFLPITLDDQIDRVLESLDTAVQAFLRYQESQGILYPIIHTHCWASAWIGAQIKQHQLLRLIHTYRGADCPVDQADARRGDIERQCLDAIDCLVVIGQSSPSIRPGQSATGLMEGRTEKFHAENSNKLRLIQHNGAGFTSDQLAKQLDIIYREQIDLLCHQFFFASSLPAEAQPTSPAAVPAAGSLASGSVFPTSAQSA